MLENSFHNTTLHIASGIKKLFVRKMFLVAGGYLIDLVDIQVFFSSLELSSLQLLHVISHKYDSKQLCGDIGNYFLNYYTKDRVYNYKSGPEFVKYEDFCIMIIMVIYGLFSINKIYYDCLV